MGAPPIQPQGPQINKGPCQACQQEMSYIFPTPRIFNEVDVSVLAIAHPPSKCSHCQAVHLPLIAGLNEMGVLEIVWKVAKVSRGPMVVGATDNALQQAIRDAEFNEQIKRRGN